MMTTTMQLPTSEAGAISVLPVLRASRSAGAKLSLSALPSLRKHKSSSHVGALQTVRLEMPALRSCISSGSAASADKRVAFDKIEIREYERSIGDNVVSSGVPISLGWNSVLAGELDLEAYEQHKSEPRSQSEMRLPSHVRMELVKEAGYSLNERMQAAKASNVERQRRSFTANTKLDRAEYALEKAGRKLHHLRRKISGGKPQPEMEIDHLIRMDRLRVKQMQEFRRAHSDPLLLLDDDGSDDEESDPVFEPRFGKPTKRGSLLDDDDSDDSNLLD